MQAKAEDVLAHVDVKRNGMDWGLLFINRNDKIFFAEEVEFGGPFAHAVVALLKAGITIEKWG